MLKQYQLVGDESTAERLVQWRDILRSGRESTDDLQQMRDVAVTALHEMYGSGVTNSAP